MPAPGDQLDQDREWVVIRTSDGWRQIRLHDYNEVYSVPGLYERWVYDIFKCQSPAKVRELLASAMVRSGIAASSISVLDLGAGNGCVAQELGKLGIKRFVGLDIFQEAAEAAERDRPGLYDDFVIGDLTDLPKEGREVLDRHAFNCLTCVAALGFGDIPPNVFGAAFNEIEDGGWAAFTIKSDFLDEADDSGFSSLIRRMLEEGVLEVVESQSYVHRVSTDGDKLIYVAFVGHKRRDIPGDWF